MALRRLGAVAVRHVGAAGALRATATTAPTRARTTTTTTTTLAAAPAIAEAAAAQWARQQADQHHHHLNYSTASKAIAVASAAATVAKKVAAAAAVAAKTAASARTATTGGSAAAAMAKTLMQRAGGALFEAGASRGTLAAAGAAAVSAAAAIRAGGSNGATAAAAAKAATTATTTITAASAAAKRREALLRHAAAVDRAFHLSRGRLPGTPFRIWRGLPFARVAARAAHGTALVALSLGHGAPFFLTTRLMINLVAESSLRAVPLAGGPLAYMVFEKGALERLGLASNLMLLENWAAKEEARERKLEARNAAFPRRLAGMFAPPWRRNVSPATARRRKGWGVLGTAKRGMMLAGAAAVLSLVPATVAFTAITTAARWVLAAFFDSAGF